MFLQNSNQFGTFWGANTFMYHILMHPLFFFSIANNAGGVGTISNENSGTDPKNLRVKVWTY